MVSHPQDKFQSAYNRLNPEQKQAVDAIDGPVMVIAGPGTGKTHTLVMRIANILVKTDTPPESILALTFTESAVVSMRKKLIGLIGPSAYRVKITTFHGFANDVIKDYPDEFPNIMGFTSISDIDQLRIVRGIIDKKEFRGLKPFGNRYFYLRSIISSINELKNQGVSPEEFKKIIKKEEKKLTEMKTALANSVKAKKKAKSELILAEKQIIRNKELGILYNEYQASLFNAHFYDYSDMIMQAVAVLKQNKGLLLTLQEKYLYILVDEQQDTNGAQNKLLELLASYYETPNFFAVGDEKQAIFRFQGASKENFLYFQKLYKKIKIIELKRNYRSTQKILDAAHCLIGVGTTRLMAEAKRAGASLKFYTSASPKEEQAFLAGHIKNLIQKGAPAGKIAVLYRENKDAAPIAKALKRAGIPFAIESDEDALDDEDIKKLFAILKVIQKFGEAPELIELLYLDIFNISPLDAHKIASFSKLKRLNPYDVIKSPTIMEKIGVEASGKIVELYRKLSLWKIKARNKNAIQALEDIVYGSGVLKRILESPFSAEKIPKLRAIFNAVESLFESHKDYTLEDFLKYFNMAREHNIPMKPVKLEQVPGRVRLMTSHKAKGLEFEYVYIASAFNGHWGSRRRREYIKLPSQVYSLSKETQPYLNKSGDNGDDNDERNLFYVALTRAKKEVFITCPNRSQAGRELLPSRFVEEIKAEYIEKIEINEKDRWLIKQENTEKKHSPISSLIPAAEEKKFLNNLFYQQGLSVTALNNYLQCPWKYFYLSLIRIPSAPNKHSIFGSAIHMALKNYFDKFIKEGDPGKKYLIRRFAESLYRQPIQDEDYRESFVKGKNALSGYYDKYHNDWSSNIFTEFNIDGIKLNKDVFIKGRIDKLEILGVSGDVKVVDYKTGKPKSRAYIEGKTKNSNGDYKRQLIFYNLLLNYYQGRIFKMAGGEIDFIEPDNKGRYHKEFFEISSQETSELEKQIKLVAKEIINLSFWNKLCEDPNCYYCGLRKEMKK